MLIQLPSGLVELTIPEAVHMPPPSSIELAGLLDVRPGEAVLDLGCGSGLLSIAVAKLGAGQVIATDIDQSALTAARHNAHINGLASLIDFREGSWFAAVEKEECFDVIVATPPQTPGPAPGGSRYGGWDGTDHLISLVAAAPDHLKPVRGRLWLLAISLANPARLREEMARHFADVRLIHETNREFTPDEYDARQAGLMDHFLHLRAMNKADFTEQEEGRYIFRNHFLRLARPWTK
jgi:methylase of polypeptide subunit release factors